MKRLWAVLLIGILSISLMACSSGSNAEQNGSNADQDGGSAAATTEADEGPVTPVPPVGGTGISTEAQMARVWLDEVAPNGNLATAPTYEEIVAMLGDDGEPWELLSPEEGEVGFIWVDESGGKYRTMVLGFMPDEAGVYRLSPGTGTSSGYDLDPYRN